MPVLELPEDSLAFPVLSVMLFPKTTEAERRQQWLAATMAMSFSTWRMPSADRSISANRVAWISDIWSLRQSPDRTVQDGWARVERARWSGWILGFLLKLATHHPKHLKIERAIALVQEHLLQNAPSESLLNKVWADFKSVSHLWLANLDTEGEGTPADGDAYWHNLLATAEVFRQKAETARVLKPSETWRTPENLCLPRVDIGDVVPLPQDLLRFLDREFPT